MARAYQRADGFNYNWSRCGRCFASGQQLGGHLSKGRICTPIIRHAEAINAFATVPHESDSSESQQQITTDEPAATDEPATTDEDDSVDEDFLYADREQTDMPFVHLYQLLQRPGVHDAKHRIADTELRPGSRARACNPRNTLKLHVVRFPLCAIFSRHYLIRVLSYVIRPPG